jgi:hypothetical protein
VVPRGLEPRTLRLLAVRSNQLSYETADDRAQDGIGVSLGSRPTAPYSQGIALTHTPEHVGKSIEKRPAFLLGT